MALQFSVEVRNAILDAIETAIGQGAVLKIRSGAVPASAATVDSGSVLAVLPLPNDYMQNAANGSKLKSGTWEDMAADAAGIAGHFRIYKADGTTTGLQGKITLTGGDGEMTLDNTDIKVGQGITVTGFTLNAPGA